MKADLGYIGGVKKVEISNSHAEKFDSVSPCDLGHIGGVSKVAISNRKHWRNFGVGIEIVFHGASVPQSYLIKAVEGTIFLRPATMVTPA